MEAILRSVEDPNGLDCWQIYVNDHNQRTYTFTLKSDCIHQTNLLSILASHGITIAPYWADAVCNHLLFGYQQCLQTQSIVYQNKVLGWYEFAGKPYYFYNETNFGGNHAITTRTKFEFQKGDRQTYLQFLHDTVFPSTPLSLALAIGYSAVVIARLSDELDLGTVVINLCGTSSTGKSTVEMLMCSPFMYPVINNKKKGLCFTANSTKNALFELVDAVFGVPIVIDDITTNTDLRKDLSQIIYSLADGSSKNRLTGNCELRDTEIGWGGVVVTSSEIPILDFGEQQSGAKVRVLHTKGIQWTKSAEEAELVKRTVRKNYGFTGKEFADYVATLSMDDLCDKFDEAHDKVLELMEQKDNLTDRLANKYAAIYLTVELLNEKFAFGLSADKLLELFIQSEQNTFDERDNAKKAYQYVIDFLFRNEARFLEDREVEGKMIKHFDDDYRANNIYGKIIKYASGKCEVHMLEEITDKIFSDHGLYGEKDAIRARWVDKGITRGDGDHNTRKYSAGKKITARFDCFLFDKWIAEPEGTPTLQPEETKTPAPVSDYAVDDTQAIKEIFGGENE